MPELPPPPNPLQHTMASLVPALLSSPVSISLGCIWVLISLVALTLPLRAKRRTGESAATPPRSVSPPPREKIPALELPLRRVPPAGKTSITALFSGLFPTRAVPAAPNKDAPVPVTNRTREEILSYGHFPDYVALSGVPLPKPCPEFDINRAIPRPYRPFRWAYHQTMCISPPVPLP